MKSPSYAGRLVIACGVMFYALRLSSPERTTIDFVVMALVSVAILACLLQLARRLHRVAGAEALWHLQRTILFWVVGLFNTVLLRPEHVGGWRNRVGWGMLVLAVLDTIAIARKEQQSPSAEPPDHLTPRGHHELRATTEPENEAWHHPRPWPSPAHL